MAYRKHWSAEALSEVSTTSATVWSDMATLTIPASEQTANKGMAVFWSGAFAITSQNSSDVKFRVTVDGVQKVLRNLEPWRQAVDYRHVMEFFKVTSAATPADIVIKIQFQSEVNGQTTKAKNTRLQAFELGANDIYAESLTRVTKSNTGYVDGVSATFTPPSSGNYVALLCGAIDTTVTFSGAGDIRLSDGTNTTVGLGVIGFDTTNLVPFMIGWRRTALSGSTTIKAQYQAESTSSGMGLSDQRLLILREADFDAVYAATLATDNGNNTDVSYVDGGVTVTQTTSANDHLALSMGFMEGSSTAAATQAQMTYDGASLGESIQTTIDATSDQSGLPMGMAHIVAPSAASHTWKIQRRSETTSTFSTLKRGASIFVFDLGAAPAGGTTYNVSVLATSTPVAAIARSTGKGLAASSSPTAAIQRAIGKSTLVATTPASAIARQTTKTAPAATLPAATLGRGTPKTLQASTTPAATLARAIVRIIQGASTPVAGLTLVLTYGRVLLITTTPAAQIRRDVTKGVRGTSTPAATIVRSTTKKLGAFSTPAASVARAIVRLIQAVSTPAPTVARVLTYGRALLISTTPVAQVRRSTTKSLPIAATPAASVLRAATKALNATTTPVPSAIAAKAILLSLLISSAPVASIRRQTAKAVAIAVTPLAAILRAIGHVLQATTTPAASTVRSTSRQVQATSTPAAKIAAGLATLRTLQVSTTAVASVSRLAGKSISASTSPVASIARGMGKGLLASTTPAASLARGVARTISVSTTPVARIGRGVVRTLQAVTTPSPQLARGLTKSILISAIATASLSRVVGRRLAVSTAPVASVAAQIGGAIYQVVIQAVTSPVARLIAGLLQPPPERVLKVLAEGRRLVARAENRTRAVLSDVRRRIVGSEKR